MMKVHRRHLAISFVAVLAVGCVVYVIKRYGSTHNISPSQAELTQVLTTDIDARTDCATIENLEDDKTDGDNCEPLACTQKVVSSKSNISVPPHFSNETAKNNLQACLNSLKSPGRVMIIGHGGRETIRTGIGIDKDDAQEKLITADNPVNWEDRIKSLPRNKTSMLTLLSCCTGSGDDALTFLNQIKIDIDAASARAPMKSVFCGGGHLYFIGDESWLSSPGSTSAPKACIKSGDSIGEDAAQRGEDYLKQLRRDLLGIHIKSYEAPAAEFDLTQDEGSAFLAHVLWNQTVKTDGCPVARKLGKITLKGSGDSDLSFTLFSDGLLHDLSQHGTQVYYYTSPGFFAMWNGFLKPQRR